jgi:hypothetical protein
MLNSFDIVGTSGLDGSLIGARLSAVSNDPDGLKLFSSNVRNMALSCINKIDHKWSILRTSERFGQRREIVGPAFCAIHNADIKAYRWPDFGRIAKKKGHAFSVQWMTHL